MSLPKADKVVVFDHLRAPWPAPSCSHRVVVEATKSRTTSLSLKMYQLRLVGHAEISTEQYQLVCHLARPARRHGETVWLHRLTPLDAA